MIRPANPDTLQEVIDSAETGDTVLLDDGLYDTSYYYHQPRHSHSICVVKTSGITIKAKNPGEVIFDGSTSPASYQIVPNGLHTISIEEADESKTKTFRCWDDKGLPILATDVRANRPFYDREHQSNWHDVEYIPVDNVDHLIAKEDVSPPDGTWILIHGRDNNVFWTQVSRVEGRKVYFTTPLRDGLWKSEKTSFTFACHPDLVVETGDYGYDLYRGIVWYRPYDNMSTFRIPKCSHGILLGKNTNTITIEGILFRRFSDAAITQLPSSSSEVYDNSITDCDFEDVENIISLSSSSTRIDTIKAKRVAWRGIVFAKCNNITITNSLLQSSTSSMIFFGGVDGAEISHNTIIDCSGTHANGTALYATKINGVNTGCSNITIHHNLWRECLIACACNFNSGPINAYQNIMVDNKQGFAFRTSTSPACTFHRNTCINCGIWCGPENSVVTNNIIHNWNEKRANGEGITRDWNIIVGTGWVLNANPHLVGENSVVIDDDFTPLMPYWDIGDFTVIPEFQWAGATWFKPIRPSDLNKDGFVDSRDITLLLSEWGQLDSEADLNEDGVVDIKDLAFLLSEWEEED